MTIDQQPGDTLRDRFDRATEGPLPSPDLASAIAGGRRRRRLRAASYTVGSLAVAGVAASAFVVPRLDALDPVGVAGTAFAVDYVAGTTIDTDLAAAVAEADPSLPAPADIYPSDWPSDSRLPDEQFAAANAWQLVYELAPGDTLTFTAGKPVPGASLEPLCPESDPVDTIKMDAPQGAQPEPGERPGCEAIDTPAGVVVHGGAMVVTPGEATGAASLTYRAAVRLTAANGDHVTVVELVTRRDGPTLTMADRESIALARGLDFPDPPEPAPAP